jgi:pyruvate/2-oxoglutarate/acetoin dehydrogenase E1 component
VKEITYLTAFNEAMREEMERDDRVLLLGQGVQGGGSYKTAVGLFDRFGPERVRDVPISEDSTVGCAVGAALTGLRPIVEILYCDFLLRAMDQIGNQAAKYRYMSGGQMSVPLVIRTTCGYGSSRGATHSQTLGAMLFQFPGLKVVLPSTPRDAKGLLKSAIRDEDPVVVLDSFLLFPLKGSVPEEDYTIPLGQADVKREGKDITVVALSTMVHEALKAAEDLAREGVEVEVVDPRTLVPLDLTTIVHSVKKTNRLMVVEPGSQRGGAGAEIIACIVKEAFDYLDSPPVRLAVPDTPIPFASSMENYVLPDRTKIGEEIRRLLRQ